METTVAGGTGTVKVVVPEIVPKVAVIVVVPPPTAAAFPVVRSMVATDVLDELQDTDVVRSWVIVVPDNVPVAVNCWVVPVISVGFVGLIDMAASVVTVKVVVPEIVPDVALIVVVPAATAVTLPLVGSMVATDVSDELQDADVVTF